MFDGGVMNEVDRETVTSHELEWKAVHRTLCDLARRRVELEAEEGTYLLEAEDLRVFKKLGYRSMVEYMVGELGYTRHAANERLRVSRELLALPNLAAAYRDGELCFSKVRELTRVVTPATEEAFLVEAAGKDSHQIAKLVSGLRRGDRPDAIPNPALVTTRVVYELHAEAMSLLAWRTRELKAALDRAPTNDELFIALCTSGSPASDRSDSPRAEPDASMGPTGDRVKTDASMGPTGDRVASVDLTGTDRDASGDPTGDRAAAGTDIVGAAEDDEDAVAGRTRHRAKSKRSVPSPGARQIFMTCKHCDRSELIVEGQALAIDRATKERLACDAEILGDAESADRERVTSTIPAAIRRKVFVRDKFNCVVPGCTAREFLEVHHIVHREHGGTHAPSGLCVLCFHHHKAHHDDLLEITGTAPHRLEFRWKRDDDAADADSDATRCGPTWDCTTN